jgi:GTP diphosphokinase / guanosine-3',5'-bis(diphosphate) 3'-diphosphatase
MANIREITSLMQNPTEDDLKLVQKAYDFAEKAHEGHTRFSGEPYFNHCFATAKNIAELGMSATTIAAGFLHDTIEDVGVKSEEIEKEFGKEILFLVEGVTKLGKVKYTGLVRYTESLRKLFGAMSKDLRVLIIKLCDRLNNIQTLQYVPKHKQLRIAKETLEIFAPLAYRLGIKKLQRDLEDLAFAYVYPEDAEVIKKLLKKKKEEQEIHLDKFQKSIRKELVKNGITNFRIDYRIKSLYSLYKKLQKYKGNIENIYDISALRITVPEISDCYKVLGVVHNSWKPLPGRIKDYIALPKPNGYRSIHTTIFAGDGSIIEVQIRTEEIDKEAEFGIASHLSYKEKTSKTGQGEGLSWVKNMLPPKNPDKDKTSNDLHSIDAPRWIKEMVKYQKEAGDKFMEELDEIKKDILEERIFVFTPKGDVIDLPIGSSVIDFAYMIHSDIGNKMSGAKVNGKFVAIHTILQDRDRVEIETKKNTKPNKKWLEHCKTASARHQIKNYLGQNKS